MLATYHDLISNALVEVRNLQEGVFTGQDEQAHPASGGKTHHIIQVGMPWQAELKTGESFTKLHMMHVAVPAKQPRNDSASGSSSGRFGRSVGRPRRPKYNRSSQFSNTFLNRTIQKKSPDCSRTSTHRSCSGPSTLRKSRNASRHLPEMLQQGLHPKTVSSRQRPQCRASMCRGLRLGGGPGHRAEAQNVPRCSSPCWAAAAFRLPMGSLLAGFFCLGL